MGMSIYSRKGPSSVAFTCLLRRSQLAFYGLFGAVEDFRRVFSWELCRILPCSADRRGRYAGINLGGILVRGGAGNVTLRS